MYRQYSHVVLTDHCQIYGLPLTCHVILTQIWASQFWAEITWDVNGSPYIWQWSVSTTWLFWTFGPKIKRSWRKNPSFLWCNHNSIFVWPANRLKGAQLSMMCFFWDLYLVYIYQVGKAGCIPMLNIRPLWEGGLVKFVHVLFLVLLVQSLKGQPLTDHYTILDCQYYLVKVINVL